ncbi:unnamed protein product [Protopolystoma xenopodis]|uniref:Uncharacterized protein n=1 Tax=Protopolystoma xenopodis TaxID=117903 RepID=A0A448X5I2_9PLAT|nr:unnamed protein product [Protopolystoma xenopodis]
MAGLAANCRLVTTACVGTILDSGGRPIVPTPRRRDAKFDVSPIASYAAEADSAAHNPPRFSTISIASVPFARAFSASNCLLANSIGSFKWYPVLSAVLAAESTDRRGDKCPHGPSKCPSGHKANYHNQPEKATPPHFDTLCSNLVQSTLLHSHRINLLRFDCLPLLLYRLDFTPGSSLPSHAGLGSIGLLILSSQLCSSFFHFHRLIQVKGRHPPERLLAGERK